MSPGLDPGGWPRSVPYAPSKEDPPLQGLWRSGARSPTVVDRCFWNLPPSSYPFETGLCLAGLRLWDCGDSHVMLWNARLESCLTWEVGGLSWAAVELTCPEHVGQALRVGIQLTCISIFAMWVFMPSLHHWGFLYGVSWLLSISSPVDGV